MFFAPKTFRRRVVLNGICLVWLIMGKPRALSAPTWTNNSTYPTNPYPSSYTQAGISTWNTSSSTTDNDWTVRYRITGIRGQTMTLTKLTTPASLTSSTGDSLQTWWMFYGDEYSWTPKRVGFYPDGATYTAQGWNNPVSATDFLNPGPTIQDPNTGGDSNMILYIICRGVNAENAGSDSDSTQAPDEGTYTTSLTLRLTY